MAASGKMPRDGAGSREKILFCAQELFCARGYDAVGVQEIVDRAQLTKPTLYYYFGSKRGLLEELLRQKFEALRERLTPVTEQRMQIREKLHALAFSYTGFFLDEQQFYLLMMALIYSARENEAYQAVAPHLEWLYDKVCQVFEDASSELGNMRGRQRQFAMSFLGVIDQYLLMNTAEQFRTDQEREEQLRSAVDQFMYGIFS